MSTSAAAQRKWQSKGVLTKYFKDLKRYIAEESASEVRGCLDKCKATFERLQADHEIHVDELESAADSGDLKKAGQWYEEVYNLYLTNVKVAQAWCKDHKVMRSTTSPVPVASPSGASADPTTMTAEFAALLSLPKLEISRFSGDPLEYHRFISTFDQLVGDVLTNERAKLHRLLQYLDGEALTAVEECDLASVTGYQRARDVLKERYGASHAVVQALQVKLHKGPAVSSAKDLRQLADEVSAACNVIKRHGAIAEVNSQAFIIGIVDRCPKRVDNKWSDHAFDYIEDKKAYPDFERFATFLQKEARRAMQPVYGADHRRRRTASKVNCNHMSAQVVTCKACGGKPHRLESCNEYKSKPQAERFQLVRESRLCFLCLGNSHRARECRNGKLCDVNGCNKRHHKSLHFEGRPSGDSRPKDDRPPKPQTDRRDGTSGPETNACQGGTIPRVYLPIVEVRVNGHAAYALLDSGSTSSLICEGLARRAKVGTRRATCVINTVGHSTTLSSSLANFRLSGAAGEASRDVDNVYVVGSLPSRLPGVSVDVGTYPHLKGLPLGHVQRTDQVELLLGLDQAELLMPLEVRASDRSPGAAYATRTKLGWVVQGPVGPYKQVSVGVLQCITANVTSVQDVQSNIKSLWDIEHDTCGEAQAWSIQDREVNELWNDNIKVVNGHYELPIPYKETDVEFPNNRHVAYKRLMNTTNRMKRENIRMYDRYQAEMQKMFDAGYAEPVPADVLHRTDRKVWYLPHHPVVNDAKPGKVRIVFDCAAECNGVSFNEMCHRGPDLVNKLLHVLVRFRLHKYAIMADIKAMYMQVLIPDDQRDALRFLWYNDKGDITEYRNTRHIFGGRFCAASSTFALRRAVDDHGASAEVKDAVVNSMYVDDLLRSEADLESAVEIITGTKEVLQKGGFGLTKFMVNHDDLWPHVPEEDRAVEPKLLCDQHSKALGIRWNVSKDAFYYVVKATEPDVSVMKRTMLSIVSALYDPLGLVIPVILPGRLLFQEATRLNLGWKDEIQGDLLNRWNEWKASLMALSGLEFSRCLIPTGYEGAAAELHHFCDSSEKAYGSCTYLRVLSHTGEVKVSLVQAKARVAPLLNISIPRLELCAALVSVRCDVVLRKELKLELLQSTFWSDSQITLAYIRAEARRFKTFVANRVSEIRQATDPQQWRFIPGKINPADIISRGTDFAQQELFARWTQGPDFLAVHRSEWPVFEEGKKVSALDLPEVKVVVQQAQVKQLEHPVDQLVRYYSDWYRLKKAVAWWLRLRDHLRKDKLASGRLSHAELQDAEGILVRRTQQMEFAEELQKTAKGQTVKRNSALRRLDPQVQDGLLVVGGRTPWAVYAKRSPVILPKNHPVSRLILKEAHEMAHMGPDWVLEKVRGRYWIIGARNQVRAIRAKCVRCHRLYSKPVQQKMADLPQVRWDSADQVVFQDVGCDLFGYFLCKQGRAQVKRYGCIFTCMQTRAVHLEVLTSLDTDALINGIMRFVSRRGWCRTITSDNGTNMVGAMSELKRAFARVERDTVIARTRKMGIDWRFNPPHASHQGGVWERMIRTVRKVLLAITYNQVMTDEVLTTAFCEVEYMINSRPVVPVRDGVADEPALTPNHLLIMRNDASVDWSSYGRVASYRKRWVWVQQVAAAFWSRWTKVYLPQLQGRQKWQVVKSNLKVGDVVLVVDETCPRGQWPLARVVSVNAGRDGLVRSARLKLRKTELVRPITKLIYLEGSEKLSG